MDIVFIYSLEDPETHEIRYIGKTNNLAKRYKDHLNKARDKGTHKRNWINSLRLRGLKPIIKELDIVPVANWQFWEHWWYELLVSWGYNLTNSTSGGDGLTFGNQTSFQKGQGAKKVVAYNKDGSIYQEYNSITEACTTLNIDTGHLSKVLTGKQKTAKGFAWFYKELSPTINEILDKFIRIKCSNSGQFTKGSIPWNKDTNTTHKGKQVYQYSLDMTLINTYESCAEAARNINGNSDAISACCRGKNKTSKGYIWKYE